jgi:hypothetical protein
VSVLDSHTEARPAHVCRFLLKTVDASEGQTRRRKRDQGPDRIGLGLRRELLEKAVADDPPTSEFEAWLLTQIVEAPASGPVRAMCAQILDEYRMAQIQPEFRAWLAAGAPSDDASTEPPKADHEVTGGRWRTGQVVEDTWCPICQSPHPRDL